MNLFDQQHRADLAPVNPHILATIPAGTPNIGVPFWARRSVGLKDLTDDEVRKAREGLAAYQAKAGVTPAPRTGAEE